MPNWVRNEMYVSSTDQSTLDRFVTVAGKPYETHFARSEFVDGEFREVPDTQQIESALSFWNFVKPTHMDEYWKPASFAETNNNQNWYNWNISNWGCKWDACEVEMERIPGTVVYKFDTPWSPPEKVYRAMTEQFPTLKFFMRCVEEQGWGVEYVGQEGELSVYDEWDIPDSHAAEIEVHGMCYACQSFTADSQYAYRYDDCPKIDHLVNVMESPAPSA